MRSSSPPAPAIPIISNHNTTQQHNTTPFTLLHPTHFKQPPVNRLHCTVCPRLHRICLHMILVLHLAPSTASHECWVRYTSYKTSRITGCCMKSHWQACILPLSKRVKYHSRHVRDLHLYKCHLECKHHYDMGDARVCGYCHRLLFGTLFQATRRVLTDISSRLRLINMALTR